MPNSFYTIRTLRAIFLLYPTFFFLKSCLAVCVFSVNNNNKRSRRKTYNMGRKNKQRFSSITKDRDEIQTQIEKADVAGKPIAFEYDDELPGGGQFYAIETGQHFTYAKALADHKKSRYFKKRAKELKEEKYTQGSAEWASGMTKEKLPPAHPVL
jgi:bud site selection protein 20